jgi:hypothetical protein
MKYIIALVIAFAISFSALAKGGGGGGGHGGGGHSSSHASSGHSSSSSHSTTTSKGSAAPAKSAPAEPARTTSWFPWVGSRGGSNTEQKCDKTKDASCK